MERPNKSVYNKTDISFKLESFRYLNVHFCLSRQLLFVSRYTKTYANSYFTSLVVQSIEKNVKEKLSEIQTYLYVFCYSAQNDESE